MLRPGIVGGKKVLQIWKGNNVSLISVNSYRGNDATLYFDSFFDEIPNNYTNSREFTLVSDLNFNATLLEAYNTLIGFSFWRVAYSGNANRILGLVIKNPQRITLIQIADSSTSGTYLSESMLRPLINLESFTLVNNSGISCDFNPQWFKKLTKVDLQRVNNLANTSTKDWDFTEIPVNYIRCASALNSITNLGAGITYVNLYGGTFTNLDISNSTSTIQTLILNFQFSSNPNVARTLAGLNGASNLTLLELNSMELSQTNFNNEFVDLTNLNILRLDRIESFATLDYSQTPNITNVRINNSSGITQFPDCSESTKLTTIECQRNANMTGTLDLASLAVSNTTLNNIIVVSCDLTEITFAGITRINYLRNRFNINGGLNINQSDFEKVEFVIFCEFLDAGLVVNNLDLTNSCVSDSSYIIIKRGASLSGTTTTPNAGRLSLADCVDVTQINVNPGLKQLELSSITSQQSGYTLNILSNSLLNNISINSGNVNNLDFSNLISTLPITLDLRNVTTITSVTFSNLNSVTFVNFSILNDQSNSLLTTLTNYTVHTFTESFTVSGTLVNFSIDVTNIVSEDIDLSDNLLNATNIELFIDSLFANRNLINSAHPDTRVIDISDNVGTPLQSNILPPSNWSTVEGDDALIAAAFSSWTLEEKIYALTTDYNHTFIL